MKGTREEYEILHQLIKVAQSGGVVSVMDDEDHRRVLALLRNFEIEPPRVITLQDRVLHYIQHRGDCTVPFSIREIAWELHEENFGRVYTVVENLRREGVVKQREDYFYEYIVPRIPDRPTSPN